MFYLANLFCGAAASYLVKQNVTILSQTVWCLACKKISTSSGLFGAFAQFVLHLFCFSGGARLALVEEMLNKLPCASIG